MLWNLYNFISKLYNGMYKYYILDLKVFVIISKNGK